jgi:hypothetical protein
VHNTVTIAQVVELCKLHGKKVFVYGENPDEVDAYAQALTGASLEVFVNIQIDQMPLFAVVLVLESGTAVSAQLCLLNLAGKFCTVIDPYYQLTVNRSEPHRVTEHFVLAENRFVRANGYSTVNCDYDNFFKNETLHIFRWLKNYENMFSVIYAGATYENAIYIAPFTEIIAAIRYKLSQGYKKIVFYNGDETVQLNSIMMCQRVAEYLKDEIEPNTLFYYTGGLSVQDRYTGFKKQHNFQYHMHVMAGTRFEHTVKKSLEYSLGDANHPLQVLHNPYEVAAKPKNFVCFNRVPRWHRVNLLIALLNKGLVENSYYSFDLHEFKGHGNPSIMAPVKKELDRYAHLFPMVLNRSKDRDNPVNLDPDDIHYHHNSYFSLVCETVFYSGEHRSLGDISNEESVFLSEKIYKPLAYRHPFLLVGYPGTLEYLKKLGYRTFHPHINEHYDSIQDDLERMDAIVAEVERLCDQTPEQWQEWQHNVAPIVEHNFKWLLEDKDLSVTPDLSEYFR